MIYLKNITTPQEVWIPRQNNNIEAEHKDCYTEGYDDGFNDGYEKGTYEFPLQSKDVTVTGTSMAVTPDESYSGLSQVNIDAAQFGEDNYQSGYTDGKSEFKLQSKSYTVTGDTGNVTADEGYDGLSDIEVNAAIYGQEKYDAGHSAGYDEGYESGETAGYQSGYTEGKESVKIQSKSVDITGDTQTITPDTGYDAMSSVTADAGTYGEARYNEGHTEGYAEGQASVTLQEKSVSSSTATVEVIPDSGYSGMTKVSVNSSQYGSLRFNEGYVDAMSNLGTLDIFQNGIYKSSDYQAPYISFGATNEGGFDPSSLLDRSDYYRICFRTHPGVEGPLFGSNANNANGVTAIIESGGTIISIGAFGKGATVTGVTTDEWHTLDICAVADILIYDGESYPFPGEVAFPRMFNIFVGKTGNAGKYYLKNADIKYFIQAKYEGFSTGNYSIFLVPYDNNGTAVFKNLCDDGIVYQFPGSSAITYGLLAPDPGWSTVVANVYPKLQKKSYTAKRVAEATITPDAGYQGLSQVNIYNQNLLYASGVTEGEQNILESLKSKEISSNGQYNASDEGENGWSSVTVNVVNTAVTLQSKTVEITGNGQTNVTPDIGYDGLSQVTVNVDVNEVNNQDKEVTITANTETVITPDEGYNGLGKVTVHTQVPADIVTMTQDEYDALPSPDENTIYLITGTEEGGN